MCETVRNCVCSITYVCLFGRKCGAENNRTRLLENWHMGSNFNFKEEIVFYFFLVQTRPSGFLVFQEKREYCLERNRDSF